VAVVRSLSLARAAAWSATWGVGAAAGVALGSYLTAVSGAGSPGVTAMDRTETVVLPLFAGLAVFVVSFLGRIVYALARGFVSSGPGDYASDQHNQDANKDVER